MAPSVWTVRFHADVTPVELKLSYEGSRDSGYWAASGETTIAPAARLELRPEGILQDLLEMVGLRREIELDDPSFDPVFVIQGDEATARAFLTNEVRRALLVIGEEHAPIVTLAAGRARLRTGATSRRAVTRIVDVLVRWHAMPSPRPLLREP